MSKLIMKYFVLKPEGKSVYAEASRKAMRAYARHIGEHDLQFSKQLLKWADEEHSKTCTEEKP